MFIPLDQTAPHLLGAFMIALACVPLVFVWQDRGRKRADAERVRAAQRAAAARAPLAGGR